MLEITRRELVFGPHTLTSRDAEPGRAPYMLAGRRMYVLGHGDGSIRPIGDEHLVGEMGGVWAHPLRVADGLTVAIADESGAAHATADATLTEELSHVTWRYRAGPVEVMRRAFVLEDQPAMCTLVTLHNPGARPAVGVVQAAIHVRLLGCWFGGMSHGRSVVWRESDVVLGYDDRWRDRWGLAFGASEPPARGDVRETERGHVAELAYPFSLGPGESRTWELLLTATSEHGHAGARALFDQLIGGGEQQLRAKVELYHGVALRSVAIETPDAAIDRGFALALANLQMLGAEHPDVPPYLLAGVPEYPQLFGCDTEYSVPGAAAAGFAPILRSALATLGRYGERACGRIPHEITTNGRVWHPGNTQETPQFATACWDYARWSGDLGFLRQIYPLCVEGVLEYSPAAWSGGAGYFPIGDGMVERAGMGSRKLDSTCYLYQALRSLESMAAALHLPEDARRFAAHAEELTRRFEQHWWLEGEEMYADSLHTDLRPQFDGHWTVVLPLQLGLAAPGHARRSLERISREWVNEWGLVHTREREERVWTLGNGLLALAAFAHDRPELALGLLRNIALTTEHGTLGALKELIPIGLCFMQLWSSGLYVQGLVEGLLGIDPLAFEHRVRVRPCLPADWPEVRLRRLAIGAHQVDLLVRQREIQIAHTSGPQSLTVLYWLPEDAAPPDPAQLVEDQAGRWIGVTLAPGERATMRA